MNWFELVVERGKEETFAQCLNAEPYWKVYFPRVQKHLRTHGVDSFGERPFSAGCVLMETNLSIKEVSEHLSKHTQFGITAFQVLSEETVLLIKRLCGDDWLMKMSKGYIIDGIPKIQEGPLVGEELHIEKINRHKRFCQLDYKLNNQNILAGLEITEKR